MSDVKKHAKAIVKAAAALQEAIRTAHAEGMKVCLQYMVIEADDLSGEPGRWESFNFPGADEPLRAHVVRTEEVAHIAEAEPRRVSK